jgi:hypothetical protein
MWSGFFDMNQAITIKKLSQQQADQMLRRLPDEIMNPAFHEEKARKARREVLWTCPPVEGTHPKDGIEQRNYYLIQVDSAPRLLVGIERWFNISSFANVADEPRHFVVKCLKKLIEEILIPGCLSLKQRKPFIYSTITTERGKQVMEELNNDLPKGVSEIGICRDILEWKVTIKLMSAALP